MNPKNYKILTFKDDSFSIDIRFDLEEETIWMTQKEIASVFDISKGTLSKHLNSITKSNPSADSGVSFYKTTAQDGKQYNTKIYNLEIITLLSYKVRSKRAPTFISWVNKTIEELKAKQQREINESYDNVLHSNKYEIVNYNDGDFAIQVKVDSNAKTAWLTIDQ